MLIANINLGGHMKKVALGILSVFILLGGLLLSACEKKVSLSVSTEEVVIYTNDEQAENYLSKEISVSLENSSSGINVEILNGGDSIRLSPVTVKNSSNYAFTIFGDKSGEAEVKVSAKADSKQSKIITVHVKTILEDIELAPDDSVDGRTNLYVTKTVGKKLNVEDYFNLEPVTANVKDIVWTFEGSEEENSQQFVKDGVVYATIQNDVLLVNNDYDLPQISLRASFANNTAIFGSVSFEVLENSTINYLSIDGKTLYQNNSVSDSEEVFNMVRNNANESSVEGTIIINSPYEITLTPIVYEKLDNGSLQLLSSSVYQNYLTLEIDAPIVDETANQIRYNFRIDALDKFSINKFGTFYFYLKVGYKDYNYDIVSDGTNAILNTYYSATRIELSNTHGDILNNNVIDVFSNYASGNGYKISTTVLPSEVAIDNSMFYISVDLNQDALKQLTLDLDNPVSSFAKIYYRGQELTFTNETGSSVYTSSMMLNGSDVYFSSAENFDILEGVEFNFTSASNADASTTLTTNFYKISTDETLTVTTEEDEDLPTTTYMSSSISAVKTQTFTVKIKDLSTISGLSLKHDENLRFEFSDIQAISSSSDSENGMYVIVRFNLTLNGYNFDSSVNFWFEHVTGKVSDKFAVRAFVPLTSATISNADKASSDVYKDDESLQSYVDVAGIIDSDDTRQSLSISRLMLEAGISISLNTNYQNASLSEAGISYRVLTFDNLIAAVKAAEGLQDDETALARAEEIFAGNSLDTIALDYNYYRYFIENDGLYFTINENRLSLTDNEFKGYVCVLFNGYDEQHNDVVIARFFALESFYSVRYLSSSVKTALLYTTETLSQNDIGMSRVDVTISMRPDEKTPTYSNEISYFSFSSALEDFEVSQGGAYLKNKYYEISNISYSTSGRYFNFRITANSTNLQTSVRDILTIYYRDENGFERRTEIQIEIRNVKRVESVQWLNRTEDNEIYLNLTTTVSSERSFTISASVSPSDAYDINLAYAYFATSGSSSDLAITTSSIGQSFNLNINTSKGGYGNLYLLPNDMIKTVDGINQILVYKYSEDSDGNIVETPIYKRLSELNSYYDNLINENDEISTYFYNNDGEKIYYKDLIVKISITIADGMSEGTAIRVYNEADLKNIDTAKYYRIMNNITLTNWTSYNEFSGMFFGKDKNITLTFSGTSQSFVNTLLEKGTIKNLTFVGNVLSTGTESAGIVANTNRGTIDGVAIDVYYSDGLYKSSTLDATASFVGGLVGINYGTVKNSYSYGVTINSVNASYVGGLVGENFNKIENCGVEFYNFVTGDDDTTAVSNKITANSAVGGIVGFGGASSIINKSYAYAYSLMDSSSFSFENVFDNSTSAEAIFMAGFEAGARINESFAFMGNLQAPVQSNTSAQFINVTNSYISYYNSSSAQVETRIFENAVFAYANNSYNPQLGYADQISDDNVLTQSDIPSDYANPSETETKWINLVARLDSSIWETVDIDGEVNFGYMYLKNTKPSASVDVSQVEIANNVSPLKSLNAGNDKGILFVYNVSATISNAAEQSALTNYNTISVADLFGVTAEQAKSLLLTSDSKNISISTNSIKILSKNVEEFEIDVHSKMDFTSYKTFKFVVLNFLPELVTTIDSVELKEDQTVLLQTGLNNSRTVMFNMNNTIYLNGNGYSTVRDAFSVEYVLTGNSYEEGTDGQIVNKDYVTISKSNNSLKLLGNKNHENDDVTSVEAYVVVDDIAQNSDYSNAIRQQRVRNFDISVYNGATSLVIDNATNLIVKPSQYAVFDVTMESDAENDNIVVGLKYGEIDIPNELSSDENSAKFVVDSKLVLNVSWTKTTTDSGFKFRVWVKVDDACKHLIEQNYTDLSISVDAASQNKGQNSQYAKTIGLSVLTQEIEDFSISTYNIESRQIKNSVLYLNPADEITNTLTPSSDAIMAVTVDPAYALMTRFTLTYSASGTGNVGTVNISKLAFDSRYGYYVNSNSTSLIENGIEVSLTEADKTGNGVFYFRVYISSAFTSSTSLKFTLTYYNGSTELASGTHNLNIDYLQGANIKVNGASTYVLAKGGSATVTVTVDANQELDNLYLQNNGANISLSAVTKEEFDTYKVYTATISAAVDAKLSGNKDSGIFYVCATVKKVINNVPEIKESRATICLVDFSVDGSNIKLSSSGGTSTYNGKTYDVFYSYINATDTLNFDYPFTPENYEYDKNDASEVAAVEKIMEERSRFERSNTYKDDDVGYYINYNFNNTTGQYEEVALKYQLWYASDESHSSAICNDSGIVQNGAFRIDEAEGKYSDGSAYSYLTITGIKTGRQLMKLRTTIIYQGIEFYYDYYFLIVVDVWSDEDTPTQIFTADEFIDYATNSEKADDYILMNDIVLTDYSPISTDLIDSLDGNGYTIHINSFAYPEEGNTLSLALFNTVTENTTLKNVRVNIYNGGQISVDISRYTNINIAGFAVENNGVIYNCEVLSYYDESYQSSSISGDTGLVVKYTMGQNTDPIEITSSMVSSLGIDSKVSGFVVTNNASIMNSRVGGESFRQIIKIAGTNYIKTQSLNLFVVRGQVEVSGFVNDNASSGYVSASFADNIQIYNDMASTTSLTAGFAVYNHNNIQNSYVEGQGSDYIGDDGEVNIYNNLSNITSIGIIGGFVYQNDALIKNSYSNIAIENSESKASLVAGFVYINNESAEISLCYAACDITKTDINQMQFSGVNDFAESLNYGTISFSYFYNESLIDDTNQSSLTSGALSVSDVMNEDTFYGFSFASEPGAYNGIWSVSKTEKLTLVSANQISFSNRYAVTNGSVTSIFYSKSIIDADTMRSVDLSYGGENNPIIIRDAYDFAMATGKAGNTEISSYKEYYSDTEVFGNYRIVNNIDMAEIDQNSEGDNSIKLQTTKKTFTGLLDGNGFTISNISLGSSEAAENYGLFAKLDGAVIMNLDLIVESIHNSRANIVGTLAGTAVDSRILAVSLSPVTSQGEDRTSILGNNVVGGVVGMLFGESKLSDISVVDIDVYSAYYLSGKNVGANDSYVGSNLRGYASNGNSIATYASRISYAGAVAGYVDIYDSLNSETVTFSSSLEVSDYDIITVHVSDAVNIYGEVAGGLFGYVGNSTLIYDATLELDADMSLSKPSYIISKNLYAGGLIGENYGGLFAVSASYSETLQKSMIEANENSYYSGNLTVERGQQSIFSYTPSDEGYNSNINNPLYIGGLVGYMGGGYIYIGYNKLNVISHSASTLAVGGIVGLAGYTDNQYDLAFLTSTPKVNVLLNDVYASGDVYIDSATGNGYSSGIIGALERNAEGQVSVVALKNVIAVNYYSYNGSKLVGDRTASTDAVGGYVSDRHFMIVGKIVNSRDNTENQTLSTSFYIIDSDNNYLDISKGYKYTGTHQSNTVGGYSSVVVGSSQVSLNLKPYGFNLSWENGDNSRFYDVLVNVESIGSSNMQSITAAYAKMYSYFLANGWDDYYWEHTENELFPHIQLLPTLNIIFWDVYNTKDVLEAMDNGNITVVLRGKIDEDSNIYQDIDLRSVSKQDHDKYGDGAGSAVDFEPIKNFHGELISYYDYANSETEGFVTQPIYGANANIIIGGDQGDGVNNADKVGIIVDQSLFAGLTDGASVEGINIYMCGENEGDIEYSLIQDSTGNAVLRDVNIVLNQNVYIETEADNINDEMIYNAGLITRIAHETSFININFTVRDNASINFNHRINTDNKEVDVHMGLLAGYIEQTSAFTQINIQKIKIYNEKSTKDNPLKTNINFNVDEVNYSKLTLYAGVYAGKITKGSGRADISLGLASIGYVNANFEIKSENTESTDVYIGGYAGEIVSVDTVTFIDEADGSDENSDLSINQKTDVNNLFAGLAFGSISNSYLDISNVGSGNIILLGGIYQVEENISTNRANIGAIAGTINSTTTIQSLSVNFNVGKKQDENDSANDYVVDEETGKTLFDQNLYNYPVEDGGLTPFVTKGNEDSIGGFFGSVVGTAINISGSCNLSGSIDVEIAENSDARIGSQSKPAIYIGGFIGLLQGSVNMNSIVNNNFNISVREDLTSGASTSSSGKTTAYVGGLIGEMTNVSSDTGISGNAASSTINSTQGQYHVYYNGNVLASIGNLVFGGAVGYIARTDFVDSNRAIQISNIVYGGAVKIYGQENNDKYYLPTNITAGGVVGEFAIGQLSSSAERVYTIEDCYTYGDVFVNYLFDSTSESSSTVYNSRLNTYNFGGIVGIGSYISIKNCYSLMTSFNERISMDEYSIDGGEDYSNTNAIVGRNSSIVEYEGNKYNSSVCMAYQEESGNEDIMYGDAVTYSGYTNIYDKTEGVDSTKLSSEENILKAFENIGINLDNVESGHKLKPYAWGQSNGGDSEIFVKQSDTDQPEDYEVVINGSYHNITWVAITEDISTSRPMAEDLKNYAIIGNGHILTRTDSSTEDENSETSYGALINNLGEGFDKKVSELNFNVVSGLLMNLEISSFDINSEDGGNASIPAYGGLVGTMKGSSFIYGVGVKGELSVGGANSQLHLGGLVGLMERGIINECYVDADMIYRASENGRMAGIANMTQGNTTIKSTYSSGRLETYIDINMYTFADSYNNDGIRSADILDCYSITQIKKNNALGEEVNAKAYFINKFDAETDSAGVNIVGNVISGSNESLDSAYNNGTITVSMSNLSVPYYGIKDEKENVYNNGCTVDSLLLDGKITTEHTWYFNRYVNYGYASHGFGYLKNVTTYVIGQETTLVEDGETKEAVTVENYQPISYKDVVENGSTYGEENEDWYLGVLNQGKFDQMYETVKSNASDSLNNPNEKYNLDYKFVLRYDFAVSINNLGADLGDSTKELVIDGQNNTIDLSISENSGLFGKFVGTIKNLRISGLKLSSIKDNVIGGLAKVVVGSLENITVNGEITNNNVNTQIIGGVVGVLEGTAKNVNSVVVINSSNSSTIIGGVVGYLTGNGTVSESSNNGTIVQTVNSDKNVKYYNETGLAGVIELSTYQYLQSTTGVEDTELNGIAGGIVGFADKGTKVSDSYNTNAVLGGFTQSANVAVVAGGVVGFADTLNLSDSYNTGFVGAGNTSNNMSLAGGIIGYGSGTTVRNCINDGAVQAISAPNNNKTKYNINVERYSGDEDIDEYTSNPVDLSYKITLTYNPGQIRNVFAFGVGYVFGANSEISDSNTSVNNIKNDGNLGQIILTKKLTFDRKYMLDGVDNDYKAKYSVVRAESGKAAIYVNANDSYGYAFRVYMQDEITRGYFGGAQDDYINEIAYSARDMYNATGSDYVYYYGDYVVGEDSTSSVVSNDYGTLGIDSSIFEMSAQTTYYKSIDFIKYDDLLTNNIIMSSSEYDNGENALLNSIIGFDQKNGYINIDTSSDLYNETIRDNVDTNIENLESSKESQNNLKYFTINGEFAAVVYNSSNIKTAYVPYGTEFSIYLDMKNNGVDYIDYNYLNKESFYIKNVIVNGGIYKSPQFTTVNYERVDQDDQGKAGDFIKVTFGVYFDEAVTGTIVYEINCRTSQQSIALGKNNVEYSNGYISIKLEDDANISKLTENDINNINSDKEGKYNLDIDIDGNTNFTDLKLEYRDECAWVVFKGNEEESKALNGKKLTISVNVTIRETGYENGSVTTSSSDAEFSIGDINRTETEVFRGYNYGTLELSDINEDIITTKENINYVTGIKIPLQQVLDNYNLRFAFGKENVFNVQYVNSVFNIGDDAVDGFKFSVNYENGQYYLYIEKADTTDGTEVVIDSNSDKLADYKQELLEFINSNVMSSTIYYDLEKIMTTPPSQNIGSSVTDGNFRFSYTATPVDNGNFTTSGNYIGDNFNAEANPSQGIVASTITVFGLSFYTMNVTYSYHITSGSLVNIGTDLGYEMTMSNDGVIKGRIQGYLKEDESYDLSENIISNIDQINIKSYTTTNALADGVIGDIIEYSINGGKLIGSITYNGYSYSISSGEEKCPLCAEGSACSYVMTSGQFEDGSTYYTYEYKIYDCGTISVGYKVDNKKGLNVNKWENSRMFVTNIDKMFERNPVMYEYRLKEVKIVEGDEEATVREWDYDSKEEKTLDLGVFSSFTPEGAWTPDEEGNFNFKEIKADLVASYFDKNTLLFARNPSANGKLESINFKYEYNNITTLENNKTIKLYAGQQDTFVQNSDKNMSQGSFQYRAENSGAWINSANATINATSYEMQNFLYRYNIVVSNNVGIAIDSETDQQTFEYIILGDDINLKELTFDENNKTILGNGYNMTFISSTQKYTDNDNTDFYSLSLFRKNSNTIKDLNVIGIVSGLSNESSSNLSLFVRKNTASIVNVNVYGNIRNINDANSGNVYTTIESNSSAVKLIINSNVSVNVLDADKSDDVLVTLVDNIKINNTVVDNSEENGSKYNSSNILISGNGGNGDDGTNGTDIGEQGKVGEDGGNGGNVEIEYLTFNGYYKLGIKGVGGNGGNGANGRFDSEDLKAIGGGDGGDNGDPGIDGQLTASGEDLNDKAITQNTRSDNSMGGNGGVGGFGRANIEITDYIYGTNQTTNYYYCFSASSGYASTSNPLSGKTNSRVSTIMIGENNVSKWKVFKQARSSDGDENHYERTYAYGVMAEQNFMINPNIGNNFPSEENKNINEQKTILQDKTDANILGGNYYTILNTSGKTGYVVRPTKVYVISQTFEQRHGIWSWGFWGWRDFRDGYRISWMSGEGLNSSVSALCTGGNPHNN